MSEYIAVRRDAIEWLKEHFPALCVKSGLCEKVGTRIYARTTLTGAPDTGIHSAYQSGRNSGLEDAHAILDEVGARLQRAHDDDDDQGDSYWNGVGAMVQAGETAILALKSDTKEGV